MLGDLSDFPSLRLISLTVELRWMEEDALDGRCIHSPRVPSNVCFLVPVTRELVALVRARPMRMLIPATCLCLASSTSTSQSSLVYEIIFNAGSPILERMIRDQGTMVPISWIVRMESDESFAPIIGFRGVPRVRGSLRTKIRAESSSNGSKCGVPVSLRTKIRAELSSNGSCRVSLAQELVRSSVQPQFLPEKATKHSYRYCARMFSVDSFRDRLFMTFSLCV